MSITKLILGTVCGVLAYLSRDWVAPENADFAFWSLAGVAAGFYTNVLIDFISLAFQQTGTPLSYESQPGRAFMTSAATVAVCLVVAYNAQRALIGVYSDEFAKHGDQTWPAFGVWALAMVILFGAPFVAAGSSHTAVASLFQLMGRRISTTNGAKLLTALCGLAGFAGCFYLGWRSITLGIAEACATGTYPFGCPDQ